MVPREVHVNSVTIGGDRPLVLLAGPCVIEDEEVTLRIAKGIKEIASTIGMDLICPLLGYRTASHNYKILTPQVHFFQ